MGTSTGQAPRVQTLRVDYPAVAAGADLETVVGTAKFTGTITRASYIPDTVLTGVVTNSRTLQLFNRGATGVGTVKPAEKAFVNGVNAAEDDETAITLSVTATDLNVTQGDVLEFKSLHVGTGLADPGGTVEVDILSD